MDVVGGDEPVVDPVAEPLVDAPPVPPAPMVAAKAKAKAKGAVAAGAAHGVIMCDIRGDNLALLRHERVRSKLAAHCKHPKHGPLCRIGRSLTESTTNAAGDCFLHETRNVLFDSARPLVHLYERVIVHVLYECAGTHSS